MKKLITALFIIGLAGCAKQGVTVKTVVEKPVAPSNPVDNASLLVDMSGDNLLMESNRKLGLAQKKLQELENLTERPTRENVLVPYNEILILAEEAHSDAKLLAYLDSDAKRRDEARTQQQKVENFFNDNLSLNTKIFKLVRGVGFKGLDNETRYFIQKTLRDFRRSGADKDDKVRVEIAKIQSELSAEILNFKKNIADDTKVYIVKDVKELSGLPEDYVANHKPNANGEIHLTTNYPDLLPVLEYSTNSELRKKMFMLFRSRAFPQNEPVLRKIFELRYKLARLLGYKSWAHFNQEDKMVSTPQKVRQFIDQMIAGATDRAKYDYNEMLKEKQKVEPKATEVLEYEGLHYSRLLKLSKINFDSNEVRQYLTFENVKNGVFSIASRLLGLTFRKVDGLKLWHEDVEAYDAFDGTTYVGRFFLDLFPRTGKFSHFAQLTYRIGRKNGAVPQGVLMCNFPKPQTQVPTLLSHRDLETFLHEFGHLMHNLLSGRHQWQVTSGPKIEFDFVEAPSQFLEEWARDYETLAGFAKHHKTGQVIPRELVNKINLAAQFNQGVFVRGQMVLADLSFELYDKAPYKGNFDELVKKTQNKISMYKYVPETHFLYSFDHIMGYSSAYYTYMWSLVMAKDIFSEFEKKGIYDDSTAKRYRKEVLEAGATRPIEDSLKAFLGRPPSFKPFTNWLNKKE